MKRLAVITSSRAEYGALRPFLRLVWESSVVELQLIVAGQHLLSQYGETWQEIEADGYAEMHRVGTYGLPRFSDAFTVLRPDMVLVEGDRIEALTATIEAAYSGIPVAHGGGGDVTTTIDNSARHAISHFACLHFVSHEGAAERLRAMGVSGEVHVTGALGIDAIMQRQFKGREETLADLGLPPDSCYLLVTFHPETGHERNARQWMVNILEACDATGLELVITYPNSDPGSAGIIDAITSLDRELSDDYQASPGWTIIPSLGSDRYLDALKHCDALVGNSSSGLYEAPSLKVPVVNVGMRQDGRPRAFNVLDCGYDHEDIRDALTLSARRLGGRFMQATVNPYGDGKAAERMMAIIERRLGE